MKLKRFDNLHLTIAEINLSKNGSDPGYTTYSNVIEASGDTTEEQEGIKIWAV